MFSSEVNLKIKQALPETAHYVSPNQVASMQGIIKSEQPNNRLYTYDGTLTLELDNGTTKNLPLDPGQMLLRGAQLRNTSWVYAVVVFTGHETKLMLNSRYFQSYAWHVYIVLTWYWYNHSKKPTKSSNVTRITNRNIWYLFTMLVIMSIMCSVGYLALSVIEKDLMLHECTNEDGFIDA